MWPEGWMGISPFYWMVVAASLLCTELLVRRLVREGVPAWRGFLMQACVAAVAVLGAKLFALAIDSGIADFLQSGTSEPGGWRAAGGVLGLGVATLALRDKILPMLSTARYLDLLAPVYGGVMVLLRVSCLLEGCCAGPRCSQWFCISLAPQSEAWHIHRSLGYSFQPGGWTEPVLPLMLGFLFISAASTGWALWFDAKRRFDGQVLLGFLVVHEGSKAALELAREPFAWQLLAASALIAVAAAAALVLAPDRSGRAARS